MLCFPVNIPKTTKGYLSMMLRRVFCLLTLLLSVACVSAVVEGTTAQLSQTSQTTIPGAPAAPSLGQSSQSLQPPGTGALPLHPQSPGTVSAPPSGVPFQPLPPQLPLPLPGSGGDDACANGGSFEELLKCLHKHEGTNPSAAGNGTAAPPVSHPLKPGNGVVGTGDGTSQDPEQSEPSNATAENTSNRESSGTESSSSTSAETPATPSQNNGESKEPETENARNESTSSEGNSSSSQGDLRNADTNTNTTNSIPPVPAGNKIPNLMVDADSSSMSSVWMRVPLLIVVALACILVC
ncbi:uncharacterized protein TM35_000113000 [Trypanosoma theileri]|uniref:Mucin-associated surface protein (MASP) n=1 Tax=Trypanosoma theileri TaxID=67003 RepID=A0A1X0NYI4_9TRYP|nr:uncharacterized protein TM35_000113000 [Trypanosoma theileri]ORC89766.1 hypothetical protein TM35_000113000 [Trypanosoma theileri]